MALMASVETLGAWISTKYLHCVQLQIRNSIRSPGAVCHRTQFEHVPLVPNTPSQLHLPPAHDLALLVEEVGDEGGRGGVQEVICRVKLLVSGEEDIGMVGRGGEVGQLLLDMEWTFAAAIAVVVAVRRMGNGYYVRYQYYVAN